MGRREGGGGYIKVGSETFLVMYWGFKMKNPWSSGVGVIYFNRYLGVGSDVFHLFLLSLKVIASKGE